MAQASNLTVCKEIETNRIDNGTHDTALHHCEHITQRPRLHTYSASTDSCSRPTQRTRRKRPGVVKQKSSSLYLPSRTLEDTADGKSKAENKVEVIMSGWLHKTTRLKTSKTRAHRQHRKFKLTAHSLEYSNLLQKVAIATAYSYCS